MRTTASVDIGTPVVYADVVSNTADLTEGIDMDQHDYDKRLGNALDALRDHAHEWAKRAVDRFVEKTGKDRYSDEAEAVYEDALNDFHENYQGGSL